MSRPFSKIKSLVLYFKTCVCKNRSKVICWWPAYHWLWCRLNGDSSVSTPFHVNTFSRQYLQRAIGALIGHWRKPRARVASKSLAAFFLGHQSQISHKWKESHTAKIIFKRITCNLNILGLMWYMSYNLTIFY